MVYVTIGLAIVFFATLISLLKLNAKAQPTQVKVMLFSLFFWGLVFLQLLICAFAYEFFVPKVMQ